VGSGSCGFLQEGVTSHSLFSLLSSIFGSNSMSDFSVDCGFPSLFLFFTSSGDIVISDENVLFVV